MLEEATRAGYGEAIDEGEAGTAAVAVAVREGVALGGRAVGTLSVAGPTVRFMPARRAQLALRLRKSAVELGGIWPLRGGSSRGEQVPASAWIETKKRHEERK